jgi:hypothetical protein
MRNPVSQLEEVRRRSLVAENDHGVDAHGAMCWNVAGPERDGCKQNCDAEESHGIGAAHAEQQATEESRRRQGGD